MSEIKPTVSERLSDLLSSGKFSDTEFIFQNGDKMKGHKLIFAIASPVFEAMMYGDLAENGSEIKIDDIDPEGFKTMTEYIYTDNLKLDSVSHAISVYKAADKYDVQHLQKKTCEYVNANVQIEHALEILEFSKLYSIPSTEEKCIELLQENTKDVISSDYASKCSIDLLQTIVDEELEIPEVELFKFVDKWAKCYAESNDVSMDTVKPVLKNVISKIRFLTMTVTDFVSSPFKSQLLTLEEKQSLLLNLDEPNSVALPENFCNSTTCRYIDKTVLSPFTCVALNRYDEYSIQWRLWNLSELKFGTEYCSPTFFVGGFPFHIKLCSQTLKKEKYAGLYLVYGEEEDGQWDSSEWTNCYYTVQFSFKMFRKERESVIRETGTYTYNVNDGYTYKGCHKFCKWTDISNKTYSKKGYILIDAYVKNI